MPLAELGRIPASKAASFKFGTSVTTHGVPWLLKTACSLSVLQSQNKNETMKKTIATILMLFAAILAQAAPTNNATPVTKALTLNTNGLLLWPTNFFLLNSNDLNGAVSLQPVLTTSNALQAEISANAASITAFGVDATNFAKLVGLSVTNAIAASLASQGSAITNATSASLAAQGTAITNTLAAQGTAITNALSGKQNQSSNLNGWSLLSTNLATPALSTSLVAVSNGTNFVVDMASNVYDVTMTTNINWLYATNDGGIGNYKETVLYITSTNSFTMYFNTNWHPLGQWTTNGVTLTNGLWVMAVSKRGTNATGVCVAVRPCNGSF